MLEKRFLPRRAPPPLYREGWMTNKPSYVNLEQTVLALEGEARRQAGQEQELRQRVREMVALNVLARELTAKVTLEEFIHAVHRQLHQSIQPEIALIYLIEGDRLLLQEVDAPLRGIEAVGKGMHAVGQCLCGVAAREGRAVFSDDIKQDPRCTLKECNEAGLRSFAGLPLAAGGVLLGVLGVGAFAPRCFSGQADFLEAIAGQIAMGLQNVMLHERLTGHAAELERHLAELRCSEQEQARLHSQLLQAQKMEAIGTLAGGIAHDFNNLLTGIQGHASLALMDLAPDAPIAARLKTIEQLVASGVGLTRQLLGLARDQRNNPRPTDLNELIKRHNQVFGRTRKEVGIRGRYAKELHNVEVDRGQMEQVLLNLYINAWQAMPQGGRILVETENIEVSAEMARPYGARAGAHVRITIGDNGIGMSPEVQRRIFEPFFTTREKSKGTGLGLASVYAILKNHGGFVDVASVEGQGTTFSLFLPASLKRQEASREDPPADDALVGGKERVLLVDDEEMVVDVAESMLRRLGYQVISARGGYEALALLRREPAAVDLAIIDMIMPEMSGSQVFAEIRRIRPDLPVLIASGYSAESDVTGISVQGSNGFIQKPFDLKTLARCVRQVLTAS